MTKLGEKAAEQLDVGLLGVSRYRNSLTYALLQADLGLVQGPAYSLEVRADVEQRCGLGMEAGEHSLLADGDAQVWLSDSVSVGYLPLRMILMIHSCSLGVHCSLIRRRMGT